MKKYAVGTDIGGSHISCAVIDLEKNEIVKGSFSSQDVDNQSSADEILNDWIFAIGKSVAKVDSKELAGVGCAMPGPFDYANGIALFTEAVAKYESLYGHNISQELQTKLSLEGEVRFMNDASAFGVGEAWLGKASNVQRSVSITLGTGFGSAFIENGVPVVEGKNVPKMGCVWHLPFKKGIGDDYFATRWFIKRYFEHTGITMNGVKEIANIAKTGNLIAKSVFQEYGTNMGIFLNPHLKKFDAQTLIIGGNISGAYDLFGTYLEDVFARNGLSTTIHVSQLKEDAAIIGSAKLFKEDFWANVKPLLIKM